MSTVNHILGRYLLHYAIFAATTGSFSILRRLQLLQQKQFGSLQNIVHEMLVATVPDVAQDRAQHLQI